MFRLRRLPAAVFVDTVRHYRTPYYTQWLLLATNLSEYTSASQLLSIFIVLLFPQYQQAARCGAAPRHQL